MARFRKKPIVIEAFQMHYRPGANWDGIGKDEWPGWFREAVFKDAGTDGAVYLHLNGLWVIWTLEGIMEISPGDYVIQGVKGELYSLPAKEFEENYEAV